MQCSLDKKAVREQMKALRRKVSKEEKKLASRAVCERLFCSNLLVAAQNVCVYMDAFGEIETEEIISKLRNNNKNVYVPCVNGDDIFISKLTDSLSPGAFGIREPKNKESIDKSVIDAFLLPGLAFDSSGARVGFGKGYYDKLLSGTNALKIGLAYSFQTVDRIECEEHDIKADYIVTERMVIDCGI